MAKIAPAVIGLAVLLGAAYSWFAPREPIPTEQAATEPQVLAEHHGSAPKEHYCLQRSGADGIDFDLGGDCESSDDLADGDTLGVSVDEDADAVTLTGYDL